MSEQRERIPGEPKGNPTIEIDEYDVYIYESERSNIVPDIYVVEKPGEPGEPYMRMWPAHGVGAVLRIDGRIEHRYGPDDDPDQPTTCCSWDHGAELPDDVADVMLDISDAPTVNKTDE